MNRKTNLQGFAHIILVVVVVILCALGYVFWSNFLKAKPVSQTSDANKTKTVVTTQDKAPAAKPVSEVVVLPDSDMNKYVNNEQGFEFLFPKKISTSASCKKTYMQHDNYGNWHPSEMQYLVADGPIDTTVLQMGNEYAIVPKSTVVLSDLQNNMYKECDTVSTSVELMNEQRDRHSGGSSLPDDKNFTIESRSFKIIAADTEQAATEAARTAMGDPDGSVDWKNNTGAGREDGSFIYGPSQEGRSGHGAYKLWYYPAKKRVVYVGLGQSNTFYYPDGSNRSYLNQILGSFKFS